MRGESNRWNWPLLTSHFHLEGSNLGAYTKKDWPRETNGWNSGLENEFLKITTRIVGVYKRKCCSLVG